MLVKHLFYTYRIVFLLLPYPVTHNEWFNNDPHLLSHSFHRLEFYSLGKAVIRVWVGCVPFWRLMGESVFPFTQAANRVQFRAVARLGSCFLAGCLLEWLSVS